MEQKPLDDRTRAKLLAARDRLHKQPLYSKNPIYRACQLILYYGIVIPLLKIFFTPIFGLKLENREIFRRFKKQGFVIVCNHVHVMDCTFLGLAAFPRNVIFTSQEETFYVPGLGGLLKLLNCVPILNGLQGLRRFLEDTEAQLKKGRVVAMYPEGEIDICCDHLRKFSDGAFTLAVKTNVPVIPAVITPRKATGLRKLFRREYSLTLSIGEPQFPAELESQKRAVRQLREETKEEMQRLLDVGGHAYPKRNMNNPDAFWQVKKGKQL